MDSTPAVNPNDPVALLSQAQSLQQSGRHEEALAAFAGLRVAFPELAPAVREVVGQYLLALGRWDDALPLWEEATAANPLDYRPKLHLGQIHAALKQFPTAIQRLTEAQSLIPLSEGADRQDILCRLAALYNRRGDVQTAQQFWRDATDLVPGRDLPASIDAWRRCGMARAALGRADAGVAYEQSLALDPSDVATRRAFSEWLLRCGDYSQGFATYEARLDGPEVWRRPTTQPAWDGAPYPERTLLIHCEQGQGDALHFARWLPHAKARGGAIVLECPASLQAVLETCAGVDAVVSPQIEPPHVRFWNGPHDLQAPLLSLPDLLGVTGDDLPVLPYLRALPDRVAHWQQRLSKPQGVRVGLVWAGNPAHENDANRSIPVSLLARLIETPGVCFYSLQRDQPASDLPLTDLAPDLTDWAETAAAMSCLDLVISADTAACHLAGALDRPVWTLLPTPADWRWRDTGNTTPWYPSMRLFRQPRPGDWTSVLAEVADTLAAFRPTAAQEQCFEPALEMTGPGS